MDNTKKSPTIMSLCTGYGGIEMGLKRVFGDITPLVNVEIEAFAITNLVNKMETGQMVPVPIWTDIKTFDAKPFQGIVDILTGGYPCQPFSTAGARKGSEDPRHLWPYIKDITKECKPMLVFFENVEGHLTKGVVQVLADLEKMAYRVECGVFSASEVGAPHQRKRVFILGKLADTKRERSQRFPGYEQRTRWEAFGPHRPTPEGCLSLWPARPGETQHGWEESRTIKPGLGGTVNGCSGQVDRLRLLGNGVVPQVAEKAFKVLYNNLTNYMGV